MRLLGFSVFVLLLAAFVGCGPSSEDLRLTCNQLFDALGDYTIKCNPKAIHASVVAKTKDETGVNEDCTNIERFRDIEAMRERCIPKLRTLECGGSHYYDHLSGVDCFEQIFTTSK